MCAHLRLAGLALALSMGMTAAVAHQPAQRSAAELMDVLMWSRETIGGPFKLLDQHGKRRTEAAFRGKLMLVYFGFTSCSDVCPTDLLQMGQAVEQLGRLGDDVQPIFITLDPARDTAKRLAAYVTSFHPRLLGLGGSAAAVRQAASAYRVYYKQVGTGTDYTIDHSAFIYLMGSDGKYLGFFPPGTHAERMVEIIRPYLVSQ